MDATDLSPLPSATVRLKRGVFDANATYDWLTIADGSGRYSFDTLTPGTYTALFYSIGYIPYEMVVTVLGGESMTDADMVLSPHIQSGFRIVLSWGESPRDLDSHLWTPAINGTSYHIYYSDKGTLTGPPYAELDVDDTSSYGPETITLQQLYPGTYFYTVHRYSSDGSLTTSGARVSIYDSSGLLMTINCPSIGSGEYWNVFSIDGATQTV